MIWKKWTRDYLPQLNQRSKWSNEHVPNLKKFDFLLLIEDSVKRCENKLGRINEIFTGNNGVVQSSRLKMAHGEINRPVVKIAPVFWDGASQIAKRAGDDGATIEQKQ